MLFKCCINLTMTRTHFEPHKILKIPCPYMYMMPTTPDYHPHIIKGLKNIE